MPDGEPEYSSYSAGGADDDLARGHTPCDPPLPPGGGISRGRSAMNADEVSASLPAQRLTQLVNVRVSPGEAARWSAAAAAAGLSRSD